MTLVRLPIALLLLVISGTANATVIDDIAALEKGKGAGPANPPPQLVEAPKRPPMHYQLPSGITVDLSRWQLVTFTRSDCTYCHQFAPVLREVSEQMGLPVFTYSFDGRDNSGLGPVVPTTPDVVSSFFPELPIATPTTFLVNVDNMLTVPVFQGNTDAGTFTQRLGMSLQAAYDSGGM